MSFLSSIKDDSVPPIAFNTGTIYDLLTGSFVKGYDDKWYCTGGLPSAITGIHGGGNLFKSTMIDSLCCGAVRLHKNADLFILDTEGSKTKDRLLTFLNDPLHATKDPLYDIDDIESRVVVKSGNDVKIQSAWALLQEIVRLKDLNKKDMMIETPIPDPKTGKRVSSLIPTFMFIDSFTEMSSDEESEMLSSKDGLEDSKNKTIWMVDGNKKSLFIRALRRLTESHNICVICSAHKGKNDVMGHTPPPKQLQHMKQSDKMKGVGSKFEYLTYILAQITTAKTLLDSSKNTLYGPGPALDINELSITFQRNKRNLSGTATPFVVSQSDGMLNTVTNLNFIRANDYIGLNGGPSKPKHACVWYPDVNFSRNTIREQADNDYMLNRAIELTAQYVMIQRYWNTSKMSVDFTKTPEEVFDKLTQNGVKWNDMLNSTGSWTYYPTDREYMSILDILEMMNK